MNAANLVLAESLVTPGYIRQGAQARHARESLLASLLAQRRVPSDGWGARGSARAGCSLVLEA